MKLEGRQILFSVFIILLLNCWLSSAFHVQIGKVGKRHGKRTEETLRKKAQLQDLCQTAQDQCQKFNSDAMEGMNEKRLKVEENSSEVKKSSPDVIITVKSLCSILKQLCESTEDTSSGVKRMSLRSLWQRD